MKPQEIQGSFLKDDEIPKTLWPILSRIFKEQWPVLSQSAQAIEAWIKDNPSAQRFPRSLGKVVFQLGAVIEERTLTTLPIWMLQRPLDFYQGLNEIDSANVDAFLKVGGDEALQLQLNFRLKRANFRIAVA